jgi:hypothetical protein
VDRALDLSDGSARSVDLRGPPMAATAIPTEAGRDDLKLASRDFGVARGTRARFTVTFGVDGAGLLELLEVLRPRLVAIGVDGVSRFGRTMSLYGVEAGQETAVLREIEAAIAHVNGERRASRADSERSRPVGDAAEIAAEGRLEVVKAAFRAARERS